MQKSVLSVIVPAHNEGHVLKANVKRLEKVLSQFFDDFEIIISEDGSTDNTVKIAKSLKSKRVRLLSNGKRLGKGAAIMSAASYAKGNTMVFMDADLASDPVNVKGLVDYIDEGAAVVIGSRYLKESKAKRDPVRYIASKGFNLLVRVMLGSRLSDHQCGFKAFRKDLVLPVIEKIEERGWFWDTELLVRAQRDGLNVKEIPIEWKEAPGSSFRLWHDSTKMGLGLLKFKIKNG